MNNNITARSVFLGIFFSVVFAIVSIVCVNTSDVIMSSSQIPILPYMLLILMVVLINPLCRLVRFIRKFSAVELIVVFIMGAISAGIPNYGLVEQVLPMMGSLYYGEWNNARSEWSRYIGSFINDAYFVAEPGLQKASRNYYDAMRESAALDNAGNAIAQYRNACRQAASLENELKSIEKSGPADGRLSTKGAEIRVALDNAGRQKLTAEAAWKKLGRGDVSAMDAVAQELPKEIEVAGKRVQSSKDSLASLVKIVGEKVQLFRRGLPRGMQAFPALLFMPDDDFSSYVARWQRLFQGMKAVVASKEILKNLRPLPPSAKPDASQQERTVASLKTVETALLPLTATRDLRARVEALRQDAAAWSDQAISLDADLKALNEKKRGAKRSEVLALDAEVRNAFSKLKSYERHTDGLKRSQERLAWQLACADKAASLCESARQLAQTVGNGGATAGEIRAQVGVIRQECATMDISLRRFFIGELPWHHWLRPLVRWTILIVVIYVMMMSLNILIFRQWAYNEILTYPLAELPKALVGDVDAGTWWPSLYRNALFWMGLLIAVSVMGWNLCCTMRVLPGLNPLTLNVSWGPYVANTKFEALGGTITAIFFVMIGLSFLIPKNISFSLWFFHVLYLIQILLLDWTGHDTSYSYNFVHLLNFRTAEGQGALIIFAAVIFYKCRHYILCAFRPADIAHLEPDERNELRIASMAFMVCSIGFILLLWLDMGANFYYALFFYVMIVLLTISMIRAVAEGGLLTVKTHVSPFHTVRAFFGLDHDYSSATLFAPLIVVCSVLFVDIKVFIAPTMANMLKLRDDFKINRGKFHVLLAAAIVVAAFTALVAALMMCYTRGADSMNQWFYIGLPKSTLTTIRSMVTDAPDAMPQTRFWLITGAVSMALLIYLRQFFFWLPHPLGMVMLVNPTMFYFWFPIFLGWLGNVMVTKYGNKDVYQRAKGFFIGMIVGDILIAALVMILAIVTGTKLPGFDFNKF